MFDLVTHFVMLQFEYRRMDFTLVPRMYVIRVALWVLSLWYMYLYLSRAIFYSFLHVSRQTSSSEAVTSFVTVNNFYKFYLIFRQRRLSL